MTPVVQFQIKNRQQRRGRVPTPPNQEGVSSDLVERIPVPSGQPVITSNIGLGLFGQAQAVPSQPRQPPISAKPILTEAMLLDWLGQQPVMFHRVFVDITGSVLNALWLTHALSTIAEKPSAVDANGICRYDLNISKCHIETGLSPLEQKNCVKKLEQLEILFKDTAQTKRKREVCLNLQLLAKFMQEHSEPLALTLKDQLQEEWAIKLQKKCDMEKDLAAQGKKPAKRRG